MLHEGEIQTRRAKKISLLARTVPNMLHTFQAGSILVTPIDRSDVMMAVALAALKTPIAGLVLTGDFKMDEPVWNLCKPGFESGLPVLSVQSNSWETATHLNRMDPEVPEDDLERVQLGMDHVALYIDADWIASRSASRWKRGCLRQRFAIASPSVPALRRNASSFPRATNRAPSARRLFARSEISRAASCWAIPRRFIGSLKAWKSSFRRTSKFWTRRCLRANYVTPARGDAQTQGPHSRRRRGSS